VKDEDNHKTEPYVKSQDLLPVLLSIALIIAVAILEKQSRFVASVTAVMPLTAPLALWIAYSSSGGEQAATSRFSLGMLLGIFPTVAFLVAVWLAARAGLKLGPVILIGYGVWAVGLALLISTKQVFGL